MVPALSSTSELSEMQEARRVVITGIGVVAPNGVGRAAYWDALATGTSGVDWIKEFDPTPYACKVAAAVKNFTPESFMSRRRVKQCGRFAQFAVAAAKMAVDDASLHLAAERPERILVCI